MPPKRPRGDDHESHPPKKVSVERLDHVDWYIKLLGRHSMPEWTAREQTSVLSILSAKTKPSLDQEMAAIQTKQGQRGEEVKAMPDPGEAAGLKTRPSQEAAAHASKTPSTMEACLLEARELFRTSRTKTGQRKAKVVTPPQLPPKRDLRALFQQSRELSAPAASPSSASAIPQSSIVTEERLGPFVQPSRDSCRYPEPNLVAIGRELRRKSQAIGGCAQTLMMAFPSLSLPAACSLPDRSRTGSMWCVVIDASLPLLTSRRQWSVSLKVTDPEMIRTKQPFFPINIFSDPASKSLSGIAVGDILRVQRAAMDQRFNNLVCGNHMVRVPASPENPLGRGYSTALLISARASPGPDLPLRAVNDPSPVIHEDEIKLCETLLRFSRAELPHFRGLVVPCEPEAYPAITPKIPSPIVAGHLLASGSLLSHKPLALIAQHKDRTRGSTSGGLVDLTACICGIIADSDRPVPTLAQSDPPCERATLFLWDTPLCGAPSWPCVPPFLQPPPPRDRPWPWIPLTCRSGAFLPNGASASEAAAKFPWVSHAQRVVGGHVLRLAVGKRHLEWALAGGNSLSVGDWVRVRGAVVAPAATTYCDMSLGSDLVESTPVVRESLGRVARGLLRVTPDFGDCLDAQEAAQALLDQASLALTGDSVELSVVEDDSTPRAPPISVALRPLSLPDRMVVRSIAHDLPLQPLSALHAPRDLKDPVGVRVTGRVVGISPSDPARMAVVRQLRGETRSAWTYQFVLHIQGSSPPRVVSVVFVGKEANRFFAGLSPCDFARSKYSRDQLAGKLRVLLDPGASVEVSAMVFPDRASLLGFGARMVA
jgi:hypothetical protein